MKDKPKIKGIVSAGIVVNVTKHAQTFELVVRDSRGNDHSVIVRKLDGPDIEEGDGIKWGGRLKALWTKKDGSIVDKMISRTSWSRRL